MEMGNRIVKRLIRIVAVWLALYAPALTPAYAEPAYAKDDLTIGISQFPATFHPSIDASLAKTYILGMIWRPLTAYDDRWRLVCMLCEQLPTFENGLARREGKGVAITLAIKAGARWADGQPVSSDDLVLAWEIGRSPVSGFSNTELYRRIARIDVLDERTVVLHVDKVTFDYNALNDFHPLPAHIERPRFEADPQHYPDRTAYLQDPTLTGLWDGPFRLTKIEPGSHVVLERNPYWQGDPPAFRRIVVRVVESTAALEATLLSGGVDMVAGELGLPLEQALAFGRRHPDAFRVVTTPSLAYEHLDLNLENPDLADPRVRHALSLALDRDGICRFLFQGRQQPAAGFIPPPDRPFDASLPAIPFDPAAAARLLEQAGYRLQDGIRVAPDGHPLAFDLLTTAGNRSRELVAQVLQDNWRRLGIDVRVKFEPPRILFGSTLTKRRYSGMVMYAEYSAPENNPRLQLHSEHVVRPENNWGGQNYTGYASPRMDALIDALEIEPDFAKRLPIWRAIQALYAQDLPAIPLYFRADAHIWPKQLEGVTPTGHEDPSTLWVEHWRWVDGPWKDGS